MGDTFPSASNPASRRIAVVGNPENRRVHMFCEATQSLGLPPPRVFGWIDLLTGQVNPNQVFESVDCVRIESPGENDQVAGQLVAMGQGVDGSNPPPEHGRIWHGHHWQRGFDAILKRLDLANEKPRRTWMNPPRAIALAMDKVATLDVLRHAACDSPDSLGVARSFAAIQAMLTDRGASRVFIKPRHGSSASGVIAFQQSRGRMLAETSTEMVVAANETRLYNALRVRRYESPGEIERLVDALGEHDELHVERWFPKMAWQGGTCDLRVVTIAGRVRHAVLRIGGGPITNLHLGGRRGDFDAWRNAHPAIWERVVEQLERAAAAFQKYDALYIGWDVLVSADKRRVAIIEANAFGDLLPGVLSSGESTYEAELKAITSPVLGP